VHSIYIFQVSAIKPRKVYWEAYFAAWFPVRYNKETVRRLAGLLEGLERPNNRGRPLTPIQQVCVTLGYFGGGHLTRVAGLCGGVSQKGAWCAVRRVTAAICAQKDNFIRMPTDEEAAATARRLEDRFHLPGFAFGVDGVVMLYEDKPRLIPRGRVPQDYWNRKMVYAMNVQIVGDDEGRILDIDVDWAGSANDARIWNASGVKRVIQRQRQFLIAGDSAYPISEVCITPYRVAETVADRSKALFNRRHSGLRTVCTENLFGRWKRRWRILKMLRMKEAWARETIMACAVLHNMAILWADEDLPEVEEVEEEGEVELMPPPPPALGFDVLELEQMEPLMVRARGQNARDALRLTMPPA